MELDSTLDELAPRVLRYCRARVRDAHVAEEVAQDSLAALVQRWRRHGPPESPAAFVFTIARRRAARALLWRRPQTPLDGLQLVANRAAEPDQTWARGEMMETVSGLIRGLPKGEREALCLVVLAELSGAEAAELLDISVSAVKTRVHRARARLAKALENGHARH